MRQLEALEVKGRSAKTGYDRAAFGEAWSDVDGNGKSTRDDILVRDLTGVEFNARGQVARGTLVCPYTGHKIEFVRGPDSRAIEIDHVVSLSDAWQKGASTWDDDKRLRFANDPLNLLAVDGPANQAKGASDAATWLPPVKSFRDDFVARQIAVKAKYGLSITQAEHDAMRAQL
jgi:hypothetical protein